jgi:ParB family chromosome partitioning protein
MPQLLLKPVSWFKPDPNQPRKDFQEDELRQLGGSLQAGQRQPVLAQPDGTMIDGERRLRAAHLVGLKNLLAMIPDEPLKGNEIRLAQLACSLHRTDLSDPEIYTAAKELMTINAGKWTLSDLAAHLHKGASMVTRIMSVSDICPAAQKAFMAGKFRFGTAYALSKLPVDQQVAHLDSPREKIEAVSRTRRTAHVPAVKLTRVRCPLPQSGVTVVVSGPDIDLPGMIESLSAALDVAKRALRESLDVKTAEKVWLRKSKAAGSAG